MNMPLTDTFGVPSSATLQPPSPQRVSGSPALSNPVASRRRYLKDQTAAILGHGGTPADVVQFLQREGANLPANVSIVDTPNAPPKPEVPGLIAGLTMEAAQGLTMGFGDEAIGTIKAFLTGGDADTQIDLYRAKLKGFEQAHPIASTVAQIGGGIVGALALPELGAGKLLAGAKELGTVGRIAASTAEGAAAGAVMGAGNAEGSLSERAKGALLGAGAGALLSGAGTAALKTIAAGPGAAGTAGAIIGSLTGGVPGAAIGGATGAALGKVGQVVSRRVGTTIEQVAGRAAGTGWSTKLLHAIDPSEGTEALQARRLIAKALGADGVSIDAAMTKADALAAQGLPVTVLDLGGANTEALFKDVAKLRNPKVQDAVSQMLARNDSQSHRVLGSLFTNMRVGTQNAYDAAEQIVAERAALSRPLYDAAYQAEVPVTKELRVAMRNPYFREAWVRGRNIALDEEMAGLQRGAPVPELQLKTETPASPTVLQIATGQANVGPKQSGDILNQTLPVRGLDYMKRGLDQMIHGTGTLGGGPDTKPILDRQLGTALRKQLNDLLDLAGQQQPVYGQARNVFRGHSDLLDALALGKGGNLQFYVGDQLKTIPTTTPRFTQKRPDMIAREFASLKTLAEREQYRAGAVQDIAELIQQKARANPDVAERVFGFGSVPSQMEQRLRVLFHDPADADQFFNKLRGEATLSERSRAVASARQAGPSEQLEEAGGPLRIQGVGIGLRLMPVTSSLKHLQERSRQQFLERISDEVSALGIRGLNGPAELRTVLESLRRVASPHSPVVPVVAGAQAARVVQ